MYNNEIYNKERELLLGNIDILLEDINDILDGHAAVLTESIGYISEYKWLSPLYESAMDISDLEKEYKNINDANKNSFFKKCITKLKKLIDWWYKEEPDKQFKTLRTVLKASLKIFGLIIMIYAPGTKFVSSRIIGYKGANKILKYFLSSKSIAHGIMTSFYANILKTINNISNKKYESINSKDIDNNIKQFDAEIDSLNDKIEKADSEYVKDIYREQKKELENILAKLIKLKGGIK